jgi:hypothetical protein
VRDPAGLRSRLCGAPIHRFGHKRRTYTLSVGCQHTVYAICGKSHWINSLFTGSLLHEDELIPVGGDLHEA